MQVLAHADTVTQLRNSEEARDILQKTYDTIVQERDRLESQLVCTEIVLWYLWNTLKVPT